MSETFHMDRGDIRFSCDSSGCDEYYYAQMGTYPPGWEKKEDADYCSGCSGKGDS